MTHQPTRTNFRARVGSFASMMSGILDCAAAAEAGRKPSRDALRRAGIDAAAFDTMKRG